MKRVQFIAAHPAGAVSYLALGAVGLWLISPTGQALQGADETFTFLLRFAPGPVWGGAFLAFALVGLAGMWTGWPWLRRVGLLLVLMCRVFMLITSGVGTHWTSADLLEFGAWALLAGWEFLRVGNRPWTPW